MPRAYVDGHLRTWSRSGERAHVAFVGQVAHFGDGVGDLRDERRELVQLLCQLAVALPVLDQALGGAQRADSAPGLLLRSASALELGAVLLRRFLRGVELDLQRFCLRTQLRGTLVSLLCPGAQPLALLEIGSALLGAR